MNTKNLLFLIFILAGIIMINAQKCYSSGPTYYTLKKVNIYEHSDTDSAVEGEVPAGNEVIVTNSFFGSMGWWEICFEGKTGWVKKSLLSKSQTMKKSVSKKILRMNKSTIKMNKMMMWDLVHFWERLLQM